MLRVQFRMVSKQMKMKKIKTEFKAGKIKSIKKAVMVLVPLIVILFFLKILFVIKVLIFLPLLVWFYPDSTLIKSFEGGIGIERLNNPFLVGRKFYWKDLKKVKVFIYSPTRAACSRPSTANSRPNFSMFSSKYRTSSL